MLVSESAQPCDPTPPPSVFRLAWRATPHHLLSFMPLGDPADLLLHVGTPSALPACWKWLQEFRPVDCVVHVQPPVFALDTGEDTTPVAAHLTLRAQSGAEYVLFTLPGVALSDDDRGTLGAVAMLVIGGLGTSTQEVARSARILMRRRGGEPAEPGRPPASRCGVVSAEVAPTALSATAAQATDALIDALVQVLMAPTAKVVLEAPATFIPGDLVIGEVTLRIYDRTSFNFARRLADFANSIHDSLKAALRREG